jgi:hypothetical protein
MNESSPADSEEVLDLLSPNNLLHRRFWFPNIALRVSSVTLWGSVGEEKSQRLIKNISFEETSTG